MSESRSDSVLERWMLSITSDGGIERSDDLHIDVIDSRWHLREQWIEGGHAAFEQALSIRDRLAIDVTLALALSLVTGNEPLGVDFVSSDDLEARLDWSPPSLYLFFKGQEPWRLTGPLTEPPPNAYHLFQLNARDLFGAGVRAIECCLLEFRSEPSDEYSRVVFLAG